MATGDEIVDSPVGWVAGHIREYVETGGRRGHRFHGNDTLLLTTRGRRSGRPRRTALIYGRDGDRYLLVASNGGARTHPLWYLNLIACPDVEIQVGAETFAARARVATEAEKPRLWELMVSLFSPYAGYQAKTDRVIPVVIVDRADGSGVDGPR